MSFIGDAASAAGKKAAQKGAQKGAQETAKRGAEQVAQKSAGQATRRLGDATPGTSAGKLGGAKPRTPDASRTSPLGDGSIKGALKEPKVARERSPMDRIEDAKRSEKPLAGSKSDTTTRDASGREVADKPGAPKTLGERAKSAKKLSDERRREEDSTVKGKAKGIAKDVGGETVKGAAGGAAVGGGVPGAVVGGVKGVAKGIVKNKTTRRGLIFLVLSPFLVMALLAVFIFGAFQSMMISSVSASVGGTDSTKLALSSGISQADIDKVYGNSASSQYPWTLTAAWQDVLKDAPDENSRAFPAGKFAAALEKEDPQGFYRDLVVSAVQNPVSKGGGLVIPTIPTPAPDQEDPIKEKQDKTKEVWTKAILAAGTPDGATEGQTDKVSVPKTGQNVLIIGDDATASSRSALDSRLPGSLNDSSTGRSMSDAVSVVNKLKSTGDLRPYIVVALGTTKAVTADDLQAVLDAVGAERQVVFVTGYIGTRTAMEGADDTTSKPSPSPSTSPSASASAPSTPAPIPQLDSSWVAGSNQTIKDFASKHGNVRVADWADAAAKNTDKIAPNGISPKDGDGTYLYASLISDAVSSLPTAQIDPGINQKQAEQIFDRAVTLALGVQMSSCTAPTTTDPNNVGTALGDRQKQYAITTMSVAKGMFPGDDAAARQAAAVALMTMSVETGFKNYANSNVPFSLSIPNDAVGSDHDSVGLMQQRVSGSWGASGDSTWSTDPNGVVTRLMTPDFAIGKFIQVLSKQDGWTTGDRGKLAQAVQVSAFPDRYAEKESEANNLISQFWANASPQAPNPALGWNGQDATTDPSKSKTGAPCGAPLASGAMGKGVLPFPEGAVTYISSVFGPRDCSDGISTCFHGGVDFAGSGGTNGNYCVADIPIYSIADGVVTKAPDPNYGSNNALAIKYSDQLTWYYLHMPSDSFKVKVGDTVKAGQQIGLMGSFGQSTGCHIHVESHIDGKKVDPMPVMSDGFGLKLPPRRD